MYKQTGAGIRQPPTPEQAGGTCVSCWLWHAIDRRRQARTIGRVTRWHFDFSGSVTWQQAGSLQLVEQPTSSTLRVSCKKKWSLQMTRTAAGVTLPNHRLQLVGARESFLRNSRHRIPSHCPFSEHLISKQLSLWSTHNGEACYLIFKFVPTEYKLENKNVVSGDKSHSFLSTSRLTHISTIFISCCPADKWGRLKKEIFNPRKVPLFYA